MVVREGWGRCAGGGSVAHPDLQESQALHAAVCSVEDHQVLDQVAALEVHIPASQRAAVQSWLRRTDEAAHYGIARNSSSNQAMWVLRCCRCHAIHLRHYMSTCPWRLSARDRQQCTHSVYWNSPPRVRHISRDRDADIVVGLRLAAPGTHVLDVDTIVGQGGQA